MREMYNLRTQFTGTSSPFTGLWTASWTLQNNIEVNQKT